MGNKANFLNWKRVKDSKAYKIKFTNFAKGGSIKSKKGPGNVEAVLTQGLGWNLSSNYRDYRRGETVYMDANELQAFDNISYAWESTEPLQLDFNVAFIAMDNVKEEVVDPVKELMSWVVSEKDDDGAITPPFQTTDTDYCSIHGSFFALHQMICLNVSVNTSHFYTKDAGNTVPVVTNVSLTFKTSHTLIWDDIENMFL